MGNILTENADKSSNFTFICSKINFSANFTVENYMTYYITIKKYSRFFIFFKTDSPLKITLEDMYHMPYIQTISKPYFFGKMFT